MVAPKILGSSGGMEKSKEDIWTECGNCKKWRRLVGVRDATKVPDKWICSMNTDLNYDSCDKVAEEWPMDSDDSPEGFVENGYSLGTVVWAKLTGYPWWPSMVEVDPDYESHIYVERGNTDPQYHVVFFGKTFTRAWLYPNKIRLYNDDFDPRSDTGARAKKRRGEWNKPELKLAREIAEKACQADSVEERLLEFGFEKNVGGKSARSRLRRTPAPKRGNRGSRSARKNLSESVMTPESPRKSERGRKRKNASEVSTPSIPKKSRKRIDDSVPIRVRSPKRSKIAPSESPRRTSPRKLTENSPSKSTREKGQLTEKNSEDEELEKNEGGRKKSGGRIKKRAVVDLELVVDSVVEQAEDLDVEETFETLQNLVFLGAISEEELGVFEGLEVDENEDYSAIGSGEDSIVSRVGKSSFKIDDLQKTLDRLNAVDLDLSMIEQDETPGTSESTKNTSTQKAVENKQKKRAKTSKKPASQAAKFIKNLMDDLNSEKKKKKKPVASKKKSSLATDQDESLAIKKRKLSWSAPRKTKLGSPSPAPPETEEGGSVSMEKNGENTIPVVEASTSSGNIPKEAETKLAEPVGVTSAADPDPIRIDEQLRSDERNSTVVDSGISEGGSVSSASFSSPVPATSENAKDQDAALDNFIGKLMGGPVEEESNTDSGVAKEQGSSDSGLDTAEDDALNSFIGGLMASKDTVSSTPKILGAGSPSETPDSSSMLNGTNLFGKDTVLGGEMSESPSEKIVDADWLYGNSAKESELKVGGNEEKAENTKKKFVPSFTTAAVKK